ncbi:unnamed protein product [Prorocentrum cordatum]|uniref:Uncharacterized protein n=1 Tax=Prorocentrum cordatum TaxID=2364126 RepID=A0ABN9SZ59_9DINO|nr:unnamed protein product [Polarella glacialis]
MEAHKLSSEKVLRLEYVFALSEPEQNEVDQVPDWISGIAALQAGRGGQGSLQSAMRARPALVQCIGRRLQEGLAQVAPRRLGPDGEIDAWTLSFVDPEVEKGFLDRSREQLRSSFCLVLVIFSFFSGLALLQIHTEDIDYPTQEAYSMRRWQFAIQLACGTVELSALLAAVVLSGYGLIGTWGMECAALVTAIVSHAHACLNSCHYFARAFGCEDPSEVWGMDLAGSDAPFLLGLALVVASAGIIIRWKSLVFLAVSSVFGYVAAAYLLGSPDMRLVLTNLLLFAYLLLLTCTGKRSFEFQARLNHLSYLREKQMRFRAEFSLACMQDRGDTTVELGSHAGGSSYFRQFLDDVHPDGGELHEGGSQCSLPAVPSAPTWFSPAAAECVPNAGDVSDESVHQRPVCLPSSASVWVEGRASACALRDLERGQRVLCYDSLGRSLRYAEVLEKRADLRAVPCISVGLHDGTRLAMAADQPVRLANQREVVRAEDLSPGKDSVFLHRAATVPVAVKEVVRQAEARGARGRIHLVVRHPDRLLVLVASSEAERVVDPAARAARRPAKSARGAFAHARSAQEGASTRGARPPPEPPRATTL